MAASSRRHLEFLTLSMFRKYATLIFIKGYDAFLQNQVFALTQKIHEITNDPTLYPET